MSETSSSAIEQLKKAVIDQKKMFLPIEPPAPELEKLHQAAAAYEQAVSQTVISAIQGWAVDNLPGSELSEARRRIDSAIEDGQLENNRKADLYRNYVTRLDRMLDLARQVISSA